MPLDYLLSPKGRAWVRRGLLSWFARHARELPWRSSRDPYAIWVSEVMLQQTQVAAVIPFFERFLQAFPNISALAQADEQLVLRHWEGLGYYRRARDLHKSAQIISTQHSGIIPPCPELLATLPGLGRYTVNAILSQSFDARLPILEANSVRLLCRLLGVRADPKKTAVRQRLWEAATTLLPVKQVGQFNQALMELGALVCTPAQPRCAECPLRQHCRARLENSQEYIPYRSKETAPTLIQEVALVLRRGPSVLLAQRPTTGLWANFWEFPHSPLAPGETHVQAGARLLWELGFKADLGDEIATIKHAVTRYRITLVCLEARYIKGKYKSGFYSAAQWLEPNQMLDVPFSSPQRRLVRAVLANGSNQSPERQRVGRSPTR